MGVFILKHHNGNTLIESLFAFHLYLYVLIFIVGLCSTLFHHEQRITQGIQKIYAKEEEYLFQKSFRENIEMVLH